MIRIGLILAGALLAGCGRHAPAPLVGLEWPESPREYAIGIFEGPDPLRLAPVGGTGAPPALAARDVTDVAAGFVADPFMIRTNGQWHMFFEVMNEEAGQGDIGLATSADGRSWQYRQVVLDEPFHLSYPCVFQWEGRAYMVPESRQSGAVRLYEADPFPVRWRYVTNLVDAPLVDPTVLRHGGRWWLFAGVRANHELHLFHSESLVSGWRPHPMSPVVRNNRDIARPGGRVLSMGERVLRFPQDCDPDYGNAVRAMEITELTPTTYRERECPESPVLTGGMLSWATAGMHQIDAHPVSETGATGTSWIACVDGFRPAAPRERVNAAFENGLRLAGFTREASRDRFELLRFYWADMPTNLPSGAIGCFVHVRRGGKLVAQVDHRLEPGVRVYERSLHLSPDLAPGSYEVWCGLFDLRTGRRLGVRASEEVRRRAVRVGAPIELAPLAAPAAGQKT